MRRIAAILLALALLLSAGAGAVPANWYEVFVRSYQDSDGNGLGDLNGLRARLDYIEDMGWRGLWLMPVMPSPSYHKYDVTDYYGVDPEYGTLEDLRALIGACHARDILVILDMPINHTSVGHPWFQAACAAIREGRFEDPMVGYYRFQAAPGRGFTPLENTGWYYEEQFAGGGMPDLNLENPAVLEEIRRIFDFWLNDVGADGFRLDAVTSYFTGDAERNIALLRSLKQMAEACRPGSLLVGECWAGLSVIAEYYRSGVDSFFLFPAAQAEGFVAASLRGRGARGEKFAAAYQAVLDAIPEGLLSPFLCNHDTGRTVGLVQGRSNPDAAKFDEGVLGMLNGMVFTYYGEEIGMVGSGDDPNKRLAMYWSDGDMTRQPPGVTGLEYAYPSVEAQRADGSSLLHYVRTVNRARLEHPAISAGQNEFLLAEGDAVVMRRDDGTERCRIAINFSSKTACELPMAPLPIAVDLETGEERAEFLESGGESRLRVPPFGIVILTEP